MSKFEVHIPAGGDGGFNTTLKVDADNWMAALKAGLTRLGEQGSAVQNVLVDIQEDNSIHVTESRSGRVFRIRELTEEEAAKAPVKKGPPPAMGRQVSRNDVKTLVGNEGIAPAKAPPTSSSENKTLVGMEPIQVPDAPKRSYPQEQKTQPVEPAKAPGKKPGNKSSPRIELDKLKIEELEHPTKPVTQPIGRQKSAPNVIADMKVIIDEMLADVFMKVQDIQNMPKVEDALYFVLDLALEKVPADAGSVLQSNAGNGDLSFLAARGPRAKELLASKIVIPAGTGFAGFCAAEGVSVAISDVDKDPRYYAAVSEKVDYETKSLLCAPMMTHGRSLGCLQLINKKGGAFQEHEIGVLSYLAHQAALYLNVRA